MPNKAPWTQQEIDELNKRQANPNLHPYTCGSGNRTDAAHKDGEGVLVATPDGWVCPYCDYKQDWYIPINRLVLGMWPRGGTGDTQQT